VQVVVFAKEIVVVCGKIDVQWRLFLDWSYIINAS
jgi:hypothetical protein